MGSGTSGSMEGDDRMKVQGYDIPDSCPVGCPNEESFVSFGESSICGRCPVFCCKVNQEGWALVGAKEYRKDWAKIWSYWFRSGMEGYFMLPLQKGK